MTSVFRNSVLGYDVDDNNLIEVSYPNRWLDFEKSLIRPIKKNEICIFEYMASVIALLWKEAPWHSEYSVFQSTSFGVSISPIVIVYDKRRNLLICEATYFPDQAADTHLVSDEVKCARMALKDFQETIDKYSFNSIINLSPICIYSDYSHTPKVNDQYDEEECPYKYYSQRDIRLKIVLNLNKFNALHEGYLRMLVNKNTLYDEVNENLSDLASLLIYE